MKNKFLVIIMILSLAFISYAEETGVFNITEEVKAKITGNSYDIKGPVKIEDLVLVKVKYINFNNEEKIGSIIINKKLSKDIYDIFNELYEAKYPIDKIGLIDEYNNSDELSMADNNSYAFSMRMKTGKNTYSTHAYGFAIDINPIQNPYIKNNVVAPESGIDYLNRNDKRKGMIIKGDICYNAFKKRGWTWGGDWKSLKDYQHFEKSK